MEMKAHHPILMHLHGKEAGRKEVASHRNGEERLVKKHKRAFKNDAGNSLIPQICSSRRRRARCKMQEEGDAKEGSVKKKP
jgi:hypothetical protein